VEGPLAILFTGNESSRSGAHFWEWKREKKLLPAGYAKWLAPVALKRAVLVPVEIEGYVQGYDSIPYAEVTLDYPFGATWALKGEEGAFQDVVDVIEEPACPTCFRRWVQEGELSQGNLFIRRFEELPKGWKPRLYSRYQEGVEAVLGPAEADFFGHKISVPDGARLLIREPDAAVLFSPLKEEPFAKIVIEHREHEPLELPLPEQYILYHPFPWLTSD
jgi:hypothetical protein